MRPPSRPASASSALSMRLPTIVTRSSEGSAAAGRSLSPASASWTPRSRQAAALASSSAASAGSPTRCWMRSTSSWVTRMRRVAKAIASSWRPSSTRPDDRVQLVGGLVRLGAQRVGEAADGGQLANETLELGAVAQRGHGRDLTAVALGRPLAGDEHAAADDVQPLAGVGRAAHGGEQRGILDEVGDRPPDRVVVEAQQPACLAVGQQQPVVLARPRPRLRGSRAAPRRGGRRARRARPGPVRASGAARGARPAATAGAPASTAIASDASRPGSWRLTWSAIVSCSTPTATSPATRAPSRIGTTARSDGPERPGRRLGERPAGLRGSDRPDEAAADPGRVRVRVAHAGRGS